MNNYKNEIAFLKEMLQQGEVKFSYRKADGTVRTARGTLSKDMLPKKEKVRFPVAAIDALMEAKDIKTMEEYAEPNGLVYVGRMDIEGCEPEYIFEHVGRSRNVEGYFTYFDLDKNEFRTFIEENYIGIAIGI